MDLYKYIVCAFLILTDIIWFGMFKSKHTVDDRISTILRSTLELNKENKVITSEGYKMAAFDNYTIWHSLGQLDGRTNMPQSSVLYSSFRKFIAQIHTECPNRIRAGKAGDGGWWFCATPPFTPRKQGCLVYSFGINYDFSFDDDMANIYNCLVRSYDPSMENHIWKDVKQGGSMKRGDNIWFYKIGIGGKNTEGKWKIKTLGTILAEHNEQNKTIDMLKLDVESAEWNSFLAIFEENSLKNVKQLAFEIHIHSNHNLYFNILKKIEELGFRKYLMERNKRCNSCFEIYYVNSRYFMT